MDLWTEFEGVTIDKAFALSKLLQTEGRSAFFTTRNANGESVLIRIIECHFDEDEILARWRGVQTLGHASFLRIEHFGQFLIEADDITAVYAVFERVDANLGDVLERGRLSPDDASQIGLSIASALEMLHANGFVHEHIEARNIYAVGETVKLRSDCIRETPEGEASFAARRRDVHDLAVVLAQVLLGSPRGVDPSRVASLPAPFNDIVRKGMSGEWKLTEVQAALARHKATSAAPSKGAQARAAAAQVAIPRSAQAAATPAAVVPTAAPLREAMKSIAGEKSAEAETNAQARFQPRTEPWTAPGRSRGVLAEEHTRFPGPDRPAIDVQAWLAAIERDRRKWITGGVLLLVVVLLGWMFARRFSAHPAAAQSAVAAEASSHAPAAPDRAVTPQHAAPRAASATPSVGNGKKQWRVVAFTYNRQDQARKKAASVAQKHPDLRPEAFSPSGRAPWLVTVGGAMDRDDAYALAAKVRGLGLPRDSYAQNYSGR
ncbi:MAG TPA: SPOR domain-containing protein [Terracidiphilus sp.]